MCRARYDPAIIEALALGGALDPDARADDSATPRWRSVARLARRGDPRSALDRAR